LPTFVEVKWNYPNVYLNKAGSSQWWKSWQIKRHMEHMKPHSRW